VNHRRSSKKLVAGLAAAGTAAVVAAGLLLTGGNSFAAPHDLRLEFDCNFPLILTQRVVVNIHADIPASVPANKLTPEFVIDSVANAGQNATAGLNAVGARTIEGVASAAAKLSAPSLNLDLTVDSAVAQQPIPANGNDLVLNAHGSAPAVAFPQPGTATITVGDIVLKGMHPKKADGTDTGLGVFDAPCTQLAGQNNVLATVEITPPDGGGDTQPPTAPGNVRSSGATDSSVSLAWDASTDNVGVTGYDVFNGATKATSVTGTSATVSGLTPDTSFTFTVKARDAAGNSSPASNAVTVKTQPGQAQPPAAPTNLRSTGVTQNSVSLAWTASTSSGVAGYDVFNGATKATSVTGTTATVSGLTPDTSYTFTVKARDAAGNSSTASNAITAKTSPASGGGVKFSYTLAGSSFIKAANGTVKLSGGINADFDLATGNYTADLTLDPTSGSFTILGFVPATAKIEFAQAAKTAGSLKDGVLTSNSKMTVKLLQVSVFGFPIGGGPDCQTATPADIALKSGPNFDPLAGGKLTGTYTLPALKGCGGFNDFISAFTAGPGNTIDMTLTPKTLR
jgi:chitodextrinase